MATKLITHPETGDTLALIGGQWQPAKIIENDKGEKMFLGDGGWEAFPAPERSIGTRAIRSAELAARGLKDSVAETLGAIPDLFHLGVAVADPAIRPPPPFRVSPRAIGIPLPHERGEYARGFKSAFDAAGRLISAPINMALGMGEYEAPPEGQKKLGPLSRLIVGNTGNAPSRWGPQQPETTGERVAYGAGHGFGDALSIMLPAAAIGRAASVGGLPQRVGAALASQPGAQLFGGGVGGAVSEATGNPIYGTAAAFATPLAAAVVRRAISPVPMQLTPEEARRAAFARSIGMRLTPGQESGSRPLQALESVLNQLPFSGSRQSAIYDAERRVFNREVLAHTGTQADRASPDVIDGAFRRLGQTFDDLAARTTVQFDPQFERDVGRVIQDQGRRLPTDAAPVFQSYIDDLAPLVAAVRSGQAPQIDGRTYQNISSDIARRARGARDNPDLQNALNSLREALDNAMERSANLGANPGTPRLPTQSGAPPPPSALADEWREARNQYRNLLAIDHAMGAGTSADRASGNIPFGAFRQVVKAQDPKGAARGRHAMGDLAQLSDFLADKIPNSGTPERAHAMRMATGGGMFGGVGGAGAGAAFSGADPLMSLLATGGAMVTPAIMQAFINSVPGRAWLLNQAMTGVGPQLTGGLATGLLAGQVKHGLLGPQ